MVATKAHEARPWGWALLWGAVLGAVFFATYNNANQYTATLEPVASFYFDWESAIPFWPWTIVPYWSIDLFYGLALFLATTKAILFRLVKRLLLAQLLCITGFLLFPLKFAFIRPVTDGLFGSLFAALAQFDLPYNQAPSLHIVLLVVLWRQYRIYTSGSPWRYLVDVWGWLIAISVLTTWQHHFIDIITGFWVGAFCLLAVPDQAATWRWRPQPAARRSVLARFYAGGALLCALCGWFLWPGVGGALLAWAAAALMYVALVYRFGCAAHVGKSANGRIPLSHYCFLGPYYLGARINAWYHLRSRTHYSEVLPGIYLGALSTQAILVAELARADRGTLAAVVDLTAELPRSTNPIRAQAVSAYYSLPALDLVPLDVTQLRTAADAIEQAHHHGTLLVACALGVSRSTAALAAWLIKCRAYSVDDALALISQQRSCTIIAPAQRDELKRLANE